jgi:hypothetical protein
MAAAKAKAGKRRQKRDATMRYIARKDLFAAVALQCGITSTVVRSWKRVPPDYVTSVECAIGRPRRLIRPDLFRNHQPVNA